MKLQIIKFETIVQSVWFQFWQLWKVLIGEYFIMGCTADGLCLTNCFNGICPHFSVGVEIEWKQPCLPECICGIVKPNPFQIILFHGQEEVPTICDAGIKVFYCWSIQCSSYFLTCLFNCPVKVLVNASIIWLGPDACVTCQKKWKYFVAHEIHKCMLVPLTAVTI